MRPKNNPIFPNDPFLCLVIGGSGKGKTHCVYDLLTTEGYLDYNNLIIYTNKPRIKYYYLLYHGLNNNIKKELLFNALRVYEGGEDDGTFKLEGIEGYMKDLAKDKESICDHPIKCQVSIRNKPITYDKIPKNDKTIVVFDDCINDGNQSLQKEIFTSGRGDGIGAFYITQSFTDLPAIIKKNASCCVMFDLDDYDLQNINRRFNTGYELKDFKTFCKSVWESNQYKHIFINPLLPRGKRIILDLIEEEKDSF